MQTVFWQRQKALTNSTSFRCSCVVFISFCSSSVVITGTLGYPLFKAPIISLRAMREPQILPVMMLSDDEFL